MGETHRPKHLVHQHVQSGINFLPLENWSCVFIFLLVKGISILTTSWRDPRFFCSHLHVQLVTKQLLLNIFRVLEFVNFPLITTLLLVHDNTIFLFFLTVNKFLENSPPDSGCALI